MPALRLLLLFGLASCALAGDWPQFLGPDRNGASAEKIAGDWEATAPKVLWKKPIGAGFAGPIAAGQEVILFYRRGDSEILEAFDAQTGASKWQNQGATTYRDDFGFDEGPRAVPCLHAGPEKLAPVSRFDTMASSCSFATSTRTWFPAGDR